MVVEYTAFSPEEVTEILELCVGASKNDRTTIEEAALNDLINKVKMAVLYQLETKSSKIDWVVAEKAFRDRAENKAARTALRDAKTSVARALDTIMNFERLLSAGHISATECCEQIEGLSGNLGQVAGRKRKAGDISGCNGTVDIA